MTDFVSSTETQAQRLVSERAALLRSIDHKVGAEQRRVAEIEGKLLEILPTGKNTFGTPAGKVHVTKSANRRMDKGVVEAQLRPGQLQRVTVRVVNTDAVRAHYPEVAAAAMKDYGFKLSWSD